MSTIHKFAFLIALLPVDALVGDEVEPVSWSSKFTVAGSNRAGAACDGAACDALACCKCKSAEPQKPWSLFERCRCLNESGIKINGYIQQSAVTDSRNPTNPPAGFGTWPGAGFLYRNDEYMFNRLYLNIGRDTDTSCHDWDFGGKVDLLYGTDYVFLQARGLETRSDLSPKWNLATGSGFGGVGLMGLAMPQIFGEVAYRDARVKLGHFYHPGGFIGFDPVRGVLGNTNSYTLIYNSILPVTGGLLEWDVNNLLTLGGGVHRGSGNWVDNNNELNGVGLIILRFPRKKGSFKYVFDIGPEDDAGLNTEYYQSIVLDWKISERFTYVFQSHYRNIQGSLPDGGDDNFYSVINRLAYNINKKTIVGVRYEWFDDTNGTAIFPPPINPGPGVWHELAFGGTYKLNPNVWLRPQIRWDWFDGDAGVGPGPWGDGTEDNRFIASFSLFTFF